jgi:hypothetical protein
VSRDRKANNMIAKLIRLFKKRQKTGTDIITETLEGFVDIIEKLHEGACVTADEMESNDNIITHLQEQQQDLMLINIRANTVRENLLKLMGE